MAGASPGGLAGVHTTNSDASACMSPQKAWRPWGGCSLGMPCKEIPGGMLPEAATQGDQEVGLSFEAAMTRLSLPHLIPTAGSPDGVPRLWGWVHSRGWGFGPCDQPWASMVHSHVGPMEGTGLNLCPHREDIKWGLQRPWPQPRRTQALTPCELLKSS